MNVFLLSLLILEVFLAIFYSAQKTQQGHRKKRDAAYLFISFALLFVFHAFKDPYSLPDLPEYLDGFYEVRNHGFDYIFSNNVESLKAEMAWHVFCKVISMICPYSMALMIIVSFVILSGYYIVIKKFSPIYWLSVLLVLTGPFEQSLFVVRQHMAMAIILYAYPFIIEKNLAKYLLVVGIACIFHKTAIIFLPVYFVYHTKSFGKVALSIIVGGYLIVGIIMSLAARIFEMLEISDYNSYLDSDLQTNWKMGTYLLFLFLFRIYVMRKHSLDFGINRLLTVILFIGCVIGVLGIGLPITGRLNAYYSTVLFLAIPNTAVNITNKELKSCYLIIILLFSIFMWYNASDRVHTQDFKFIS